MELIMSRFTVKVVDAIVGLIKYYLDQSEIKQIMSQNKQYLFVYLFIIF